MGTSAGPRDRILVLSGWEPELAALRGALDAEPALARQITAMPAGVGLVEASIGATRALAHIRARAVIFVGTAGVYPTERDDLVVGQAVIGGLLKLVSTAALRQEGYLPSVLPAADETDAVLRRALARRSERPVANIACPLAITSSARAARRIARDTACEVENLEAFAVARAARAYHVPFAAVLGLSNAVGPAAHGEWRRFAARASQAACEAVLAWVRATTPPKTRRPSAPPPARARTGGRSRA